ncbi:MAG: GGDEF domain-containing protein [Peptococcaceae bacterium]|nr:GGDEF domain-containing protein [Peptococcaceae bacterium]
MGIINFCLNQLTRWRRWSLRVLSVLFLGALGWGLWVTASGSGAFAMGVLAVCVVSGLFFMVWQPGHRSMVLLSLADAMLLLRIITESGGETLFPGINVSEEMMLSVQMMFLLAGAMFFYMYAISVCRHHVSFSPVMNVLGVGICLVFVAVFGVWPALIAGPFYWAFVGGFVLSRLYLLGMTRHYCREEKSWRTKLVLGQVVMITLAVFYDLLTVELVLPTLTVYLFMLALLFNVVTRLLEFNANFLDQDRPGSSLERLVAERTRQLTELNERLASLSERDALTGTYNRLRFDTLLDEMIDQQQQEGFPLYLSILDLDYFKKINDRFGHDQGDVTLKELVETVAALLPQKATLARLGGEEFVILIPDETPEEAFALVESIRKRLEALSHSPRRTTASFGLAAYRAEMSAKDFFKEADRCLYKAKAAGRNTVVVAWQ